MYSLAIKKILLGSLLLALVGGWSVTYAAPVVITPLVPAEIPGGDSGTYYIKGAYAVAAPATEVPDAFSLVAAYGTLAGVPYVLSSMPATFTPIPGYDLSTAGNFTITLTGLNPENLPSLTYYYDIVDNEGTLYHSGSFSVSGIAATDIAGTETEANNPTLDYTLLAPLPIPGLEGGTVNIGPTSDSAFDFGDYVNGLLKFAIGIAGALAVVMIVIGGIQYMSTDNFGEKAAGKDQIKNAVGGVVLLLGAYMILNTINPNLVDFHFEITKATTKADPIIDASTPPTENPDGTYSGSMCGSWEKGEAWPIDIPTLRSNFENSPLAGVPGLGIDVRSSLGTGEEGYCSEVGDPGCTTVYYEPAAATRLNTYMSQLKSACVGCALVITGGSECWLHKTHGPSAAVVDMSVDSGLTKLITGKTSFPKNCSWYNLPPPFTQGQALAESSACDWNPADHWHINFDKPFE